MLGRRGPGSGEEEPEMDERLKNIEPKMVELITNEVRSIDLNVLKVVSSNGSICNTTFY